MSTTQTTTQINTTTTTTTTTTNIPLYQPNQEIFYVDLIGSYGSTEIQAALALRPPERDNKLRYGPIPGFVLGDVFPTLDSLVNTELHTDRTCIVSNALSAAASSIVVYENGNHDDRDNILLFRSPLKIRTLNDGVMVPYAEGMNLSLMNNIKHKIPVRVIRASPTVTDPISIHTNTNNTSNTSNISHFKSNVNWKPTNGYRYDGLFMVQNYMFDRDLNESNSTCITWSMMFSMVKIYGQENVNLGRTAVLSSYRSLFEVDPLAPPDEFAPFMPSSNSISTTLPIPTFTNHSALPIIGIHQQQHPPTILQQPQQQQLPPPSSSQSPIPHDMVRTMLNDLRRRQQQQGRYTPEIDHELMRRVTTTTTSTTTTDHIEVPQRSTTKNKSTNPVYTSRNKEFVWHMP
jgi:hypothetical protein